MNGFFNMIVSFLFNKTIAEGPAWQKKIETAKKQQLRKENPMYEYTEKSEEKAREIKAIDIKIHNCLIEACKYKNEGRKQQALQAMGSKKLLEKKKKLLEQLKYSYDQAILNYDTAVLQQEHVVGMGEIIQKTKKVSENINRDNIEEMMIDNQETIENVNNITQMLTGEDTSIKDEIDNEIEIDSLMEELDGLDMDTLKQQQQEVEEQEDLLLNELKNTMTPSPQSQPIHNNNNNNNNNNSFDFNRAPPPYQSINNYQPPPQYSNFANYNYSHSSPQSNIYYPQSTSHQTQFNNQYPQNAHVNTLHNPYVIQSKPKIKQPIPYKY